MLFDNREVKHSVFESLSLLNLKSKTPKKNAATYRDYRRIRIRIDWRIKEEDYKFTEL